MQKSTNTKTQEFFFEAMGLLGYAFGLADGEVEDAEAAAVVEDMEARFAPDYPETCGITRQTFSRAVAGNMAIDAAYHRALQCFSASKPLLHHYHDYILELVKKVVESDNQLTKSEKALFAQLEKDLRRLLPEL